MNHKEIGSPGELRKERYLLSLTLEEVYEILNVKKEYLQILEDDKLGLRELERRLNPLYARAYHRIYMRYLKLALLNQQDGVHQAVKPSKKPSRLNLFAALSALVALSIAIWHQTV